MMKITYFAIFMGMLLVLAGCQTKENTTQNKITGKATTQTNEIKILRMGLIPADDAEEMLRDYEPVRLYLEEKLGMSVEIKVTSDYTAAIEAMRAKHIDMAWFGPFSYVIAANIAGAEAIVNGVRRSDGRSDYHSIIVTRVDSGIKSIKDLKGRSFAFVDPASTSGNLIPRKMLKENGIDPDKDFKTVYYAGTHNAVELAVANKKVDAGADSDNSYARMVAAGEINSKINKIIFTSPSIPGSPIAVRKDLPEDFKKKIKNALLTMDEQTIHKVSGWGDIAKYKEVEDSDYNIIRDTAKILGMDITSPEVAKK